MKKYKIIKWNKPVEEYQVPKGWRLATFQELIRAYDNGIIVLQPFPVVYFVQNFSKKNIKNNWTLSSCYLNGDSGLVSGGSILSYSGDFGRVVLARVKK